MAADIKRVQAGHLYQFETTPGYLLRSVDDAEDDWRLVIQRPETTMDRNDDTDVGGDFMPTMTSVTYADGAQQFFNPDDWAEVRPA